MFDVFEDDDTRVEVLAVDEQRAEKLAAIEEEVAALVVGDSAINFQEIEARLGEIYAEAEAHHNSDAMQRAVTVFEHAQMLATSNSQLRGVAVGSLYGQREAEAQRDELIEAMEDQDTGHPLVGRLVEDVSEQLAYEWQMDFFDDSRAEALDDCTQNAMDLLSMENEAAYRLAHILVVGYTGYGDHTIPDETLAEIGRFIAEKLGADHA